MDDESDQRIIDTICEIAQKYIDANIFEIYEAVKIGNLKFLKAALYSDIWTHSDWFCFKGDEKEIKIITPLKNTIIITLISNTDSIDSFLRPIQINIS